MAKKNPTGWVGWVYFAGTMLLVVGGLEVINGLVGIFRKSFYVVTETHLIALNYTAWGWISLIVGLLLILTGLGLWAGSTWARIVALLLVVLSMLHNIAFITAYPLWSTTALIIDGLIIYALTAHGGEAGAE